MNAIYYVGGCMMAVWWGLPVMQLRWSACALGLANAVVVPSGTDDAAAMKTIVGEEFALSSMGYEVCPWWPLLTPRVGARAHLLHRHRHPHLQAWARVSRLRRSVRPAGRIGRGAECPWGEGHRARPQPTSAGPALAGRRLTCSLRRAAGPCPHGGTTRSGRRRAMPRRLARWVGCVGADRSGVPRTWNRRSSRQCAGAV